MVCTKKCAGICRVSSEIFVNLQSYFRFDVQLLIVRELLMLVASVASYLNHGCKHIVFEVCNCVVELWEGFKRELLFTCILQVATCIRLF